MNQVSNQNQSKQYSTGVINAKDIFTPDEYNKIKFILKLFNGKVIKLRKYTE